MTKTQLRKKILRTELIHYGNKGFDPKKFDTIKNIDFEKPIGGLWTSPTESDYGFNDYNKGTNVRYYEENEFFKLKLKEDAKVFIIDSQEDLKNAPHITLLETIHFNFTVMDFEKIAQNYDAIWLTINGLVANRGLMVKYRLTTWDCESVLILNPNCFKPVKTKQYIEFLQNQTQNEIIYYLKMGYTQKQIYEAFDDHEIKISMSAIEKFIYQIKKDFKADSLFHLGYILGKIDQKHSGK